MRFLFASMLALLPVSAAGATPEPLVGTWGTTAQCSRALLAPHGTVRASPIAISASWMEQGGISCLLKWFPVQWRNDGLFAVANAICGEDSAQAFRVDFLLEGNSLLLLWNETLKNGPLHRCPPTD